MIPPFPQFKPIELSDKEDIESITRLYPPYSDFNFVSMWSWDIRGDMRLSLLHGNLVVRFTDYITGKPFYSFLGKNEVNDTASTLLELSKKEGLDLNLKLVPEDSMKDIDSTKFKITEDRDNFDYIVPIDALQPPDGSIRKLSTRRKLANKLKTVKNVSVVPIDLSDSKIVEEILRVFSLWEKKRGVGIDRTKNLKTSIERNFLLSRQKNTVSLGAFANGFLVGYTVNEIIDDGYYALGNFQQADLKYSHGLYALLMEEAGACLSTLGCKYINLEQDLGIEGLRRWKLSYNSSFLKKYTVTPIEHSILL